MSSHSTATPAEQKPWYDVWLKKLGYTAIAIIAISIVIKVFSGGSHSKTFTVRIDSLNKEYEICGLESGKMKFKFQNPVYLLLASGTSRIFTQDILINDTVPNEEFSVKGECAKLRFANPKWYLENTKIDPQTLLVTFYEG